MTATTALREALNQGISSGNLVDTKIILYSHRDSSGRICRPKALYANSHVLKTVPYFNDLLFGGFTESQSKDFNREAIDEEEFAEDYGHLSDSDLEDEDEQVTPPEQKVHEENPPPPTSARSFLPASPAGFGGLWLFYFCGVAAWLLGVHGGALPVTYHTSDVLEVIEASPDEVKSRACSSNLFAVPGEDEKLIFEEYEEHIEKGKVIKIPDMAFVTFQAFLMYLYTETIEFAPFGSEENRRSRSEEIATPSDDKVPRSSPKSIYRLADKYDIPALKTLALNHIRVELAKCDIVEEAFSRFASRHEDIRNLYIQQLAYNWIEDWTEATRASVEKKIDSFVEEGLEHATEMLSALWEIVNKDRNIKAPENTSSTTTQATSPVHWDSVKTALIRSIRKGVFFDRKYWARYLKIGNVLKPIYFSSAIMEDKSEQLGKLVKYLKGRNTLIRDLKGELNLESDYEGDWVGLGLEIPQMKEEDEEETRAVLTTGSFSAWRSLFFYRCTDSISFAPLKSQGVDSRLEYIRENTMEGAPPPCSPKSIYILASLLEIKSLYESAFADIKSKVSVDNVVDEFFSWVPASHKEVTEMQCDLLMSNSRDSKTIALVKENIGHIFDGSLPHCAETFKLGLKKAFDLKKKERQPPSAKLRCSNSGCAWYRNPPPYSSVTASVYCPCCGYYYYLMCVECGCTRAALSVSCLNCGGRFI